MIQYTHNPSKRDLIQQYEVIRSTMDRHMGDRQEPGVSLDSSTVLRYQMQSIRSQILFAGARFGLSETHKFHLSKFDSDEQK